VTFGLAYTTPTMLDSGVRAVNWIGVAFIVIGKFPFVGVDQKQNKQFHVLWRLAYLWRTFLVKIYSPQA
jgi:hypothetical protein